jgi:hypothetical protein
MKRDTQHLLLPSNLQLNDSQPVLKLCQWLSMIGVLVGDTRRNDLRAVLDARSGPM